MKRKGKSLAVLLLSFIFIAAVFLAAIPYGNGKVSFAAPSDQKLFWLKEPTSTGDIWATSSRGYSGATSTGGYGGNPQFENSTPEKDTTNGGEVENVVNWSELVQETDQAAYLRKAGKINGMTSGTALLNTAASTDLSATGTTAGTTTRFPARLKWDGGSGKALWWWDVVLDDPKTSYSLSEISAQFQMTSTNASSNTTVNMFVIAYSSGTPGQVNANPDGSDGNLTKLLENNLFMLVNNAGTNHEDRAGNGLKFTVKLSNSDFRGTKFLRMGVFMNGAVNWQHCPVISDFGYQTNNTYEPPVNTTISSVDDLKLLQTAVNIGFDQSGKTFQLNNDLDMTNENWTPIGELTESNYANAQNIGFAGTFDGQNHKITGFNQNAQWTTGLFGVIKSGGTVKNLAIDGTQVRSNNGNGNGHGVFASWCFGTLQNVVNYGVDIGTASSYVYASAGGIAGYLGASGRIENAVNFGNIWYQSNSNAVNLTGLSYTDIKSEGGGIAAVSAGGMLSNVANYGSVKGYTGYPHVGGIVAYMYSGTVSYAYNYGELYSSANDYVGGIAGRAGNAITLDYVYQGGSITSGGSATDPIIKSRPSGTSIPNWSSYKPIALNTTWTAENWGIDPGIHNGGVYLKTLHDLLMSTGMLQGSVTEVTGDVTETYRGSAYTVNATDRFTVHNEFTWINGDVKTAYNANVNIEFAKITGITKGGTAVSEILNAGDYTVSAQYSYGSHVFATNQFTFTVNPLDLSGGTWSATEGEYTVGEQSVNYGWSVTLEGVDITVDYTYEQKIGDRYETINHAPVDAGEYRITATLNYGSADANNFMGANTATTTYIITPKQITVEWTGAQNGRVEKVYNGDFQYPDYTGADSFVNGVSSDGTRLAYYFTDSGNEYTYSGSKDVSGGNGTYYGLDIVLKAEGEKAGNYAIVCTPVEFVIVPKELTVNWVGLTDGKVSQEFNGSWLKPTYNFGADSLIVGDGSTVAFIDSGNNISDGWRNATGEEGIRLRLSVVQNGAASNNYVILGETNVIFIITPKEIGGTWSTENFVYDGVQHSPEFTLEESAIAEGDLVWTEYEYREKTGGALGHRPMNAGEYVATVSIAGTNGNNYVLSNGLYEKEFSIAKKPYTIIFRPLSETAGGVTANTVGNGQWKVDRTNTVSIMLGAWLDVTTPANLALTFTSTAGTLTGGFVSTATNSGISYSVTNALLQLPTEQSITSITISVALNDTENFVYKEGETAPADQTVLLKRKLTGTLSEVNRFYGEGEKTEVNGKTYHMLTTIGSVEAKEGWTMEGADQTIIPHWDMTAGGQLRLAVGKAGTTSFTLKFAETAEYLATDRTVNVTFARKPITFGGEDKTVNYSLKQTFSAADFIRHSGLAYDDHLSDVFAMTSDYDPVVMQNVKRGENGSVGSYQITVTVPQNPNYSFTDDLGAEIPTVDGKIRVSSTLTVLPGSLIVEGGTYSVKYGNEIPEIALTYSGFVAGETAENATGFVAPTITLPTPQDGKTFLDWQTDAYPIELTGGSAQNYRLQLIPGSLVIMKGDLGGIDASEYHIDFNGRQQTYAGTVTVLIPQGGTPLKEGWSYRVTGYQQNEAAASPFNAGAYDVLLTVYPTADDNYANFDAVIGGVFHIDPIAPSLNVHITPDLRYNGAVQRGVSAEIGGVGGNAPGTVRVTYYFGDSLEATDPINAGTYRVTIEYEPVVNDNYLAKYDTVSFEIGTADLRLDFDTASADYNGKAHEISITDVKGVDGTVLTNSVDLNVVYRKGSEQISAPKNAGIYGVTVTATPDASLTNYHVTTVENEEAVIIRTVKITGISLSETTVRYDGTNKEPIGTVAEGVEGGDVPRGSFRYEYRRVGDAVFVTNVRNAGRYIVKVIYVPLPGGNYSSGFEAVFGDDTHPFMIIEAAPVSIQLSKSEYAFSGERFSATARFSSSVAGEEPQGTLKYEYYEGASANPNVEYFISAPRDAGTYGVKVVYEPIANDNFIRTEASFDDVIVIMPMRPNITLVSNIGYFSGNGIAANDANVRGGAKDTEGPKGQIDYWYWIAGRWTQDLPVAVGSYNVRVTYTAVVGGVTERNYVDAERTFSAGVVINNRRPNIVLVAKTATYDGSSIRPNDAVVGDGVSAKGVVVYEYAQGATWQVNAPVNVGTYSVRVIYRAAAEDNYASAVAEFESALTIEPAELVITPVAGQHKIYDGKPIEEIEFNRPQLAPGNQWQGELYAPGVDQGEYEISVGTLSAGRNYNINFTSGVVYRIEKRTVYFRFSEINPVYDGTYKQTFVECDGVLEGEDPLCTLTYEGDRMNVGSFRAIAVVAGKNYQASANNYHDYAITPASMGEIPFADSTVRYDGLPHSILVTVPPEDSKVVYESAHTFTEIGAYIVRARVVKPNYYDVELRATLVIQKGASKVSVTVPSETYRYGDDLPQLIAVGDVGTAVLDEGQTLVPGEKEYSWTFTPYDSAHYETVKGTIKIPVVKATADISLKGSLRQEENKTHALAPSIPDTLSGEVSIVYVDSKGSILTGIPTEAGNYIVRITYEGDEYYEPIVYEKQLIITEKTSYTWMLYVLGGILVLAIASGIFYSTKRKIK